MINTKIEKGLMIIDRGFHNDAVFDIIDRKEGMAYLTTIAYIIEEICNQLNIVD